MLLALLPISLVGLLVVGFVAYPYRGRSVPKAEKLSGAVVAVTEKVDPGESPPLGVLSTPEKSRQMSRRFEKVESVLKSGARVLTPGSRA